MRCAVFGCSIDSQSKHFKNTGEIMFFRFPKEPTLRKAWQDACGRTCNAKNARVCSKHFKASDYARDLRYELMGYPKKKQRLIKPDVLPTEYLPVPAKPSVPIDSFASEGHQRIQEVKINRIDGGEENCLGNQRVNVDNNSQDHKVLTKNVGTNTKVDRRDKVIVELKNKVIRLQCKVEVMRALLTSEQIKRLENPKGLLFVVS